MQTVLWNSAGEDEKRELKPITTDLHQSGLDVSGTLLYPAIFVGEYEWGCAGETYKLGDMTTPNLGDAENDAVLKLHASTSDTVLLVASRDHINSGTFQITGALREVCIAPTGGGKPYRLSQDQGHRQLVGGRRRSATCSQH